MSRAGQSLVDDAKILESQIKSLLSPPEDKFQDVSTPKRVTFDTQNRRQPTGYWVSDRPRRRYSPERQPFHTSTPKEYLQTRAGTELALPICRANKCSVR